MVNARTLLQEKHAYRNQAKKEKKNRISHDWDAINSKCLRTWVGDPKRAQRVDSSTNQPSSNSAKLGTCHPRELEQITVFRGKVNTKEDAKFIKSQRCCQCQGELEVASGLIEKVTSSRNGLPKQTLDSAKVQPKHRLQSSAKAPKFKKSSP